MRSLGSLVSLDHRNIADLAAAVRQGDVGLWIGSSWRFPQNEADLAEITKVEWLAVWSELTERTLARRLETDLPDTGRRLIEVPNQLEAALGTLYRLPEIMPFFYLDGLEVDRDPLTGRQRRISRDIKTGELSRLGAGVLFIDGYDDADLLLDLLRHEILDAGPELRQLVVCGISEKNQERLMQELPANILSRLLLSSLELVTLIRNLYEAAPELPEGHSLRVGSAYIDIEPLLKTEPPLDQTFEIVTAQAIRPTEASEDPRAILYGFLSGEEAPWRAFAHNLHWERYPKLRRTLRIEINRVQEGSYLASCITIPAEQGSGLSTVLQQLAYEAAVTGCPTLVHRGEGAGIDYQLLRSFLTDLYRDLAEPWDKLPAIIVFDVEATQADSKGLIASLPKRLHQDGRRVLVIRGVPIREGDQGRRKDLTPDLRVYDKNVPPLEATLTTSEQEDLAAWAELVGEAQASKRIKDWRQSDDAIPLLVCLYFILTEDLRDAAGLGRSLVRRVLRHLEGLAESTAETDNSRRKHLSGQALVNAVEALRSHFANKGLADLQDDPATIVLAVFYLALAGPLRVGLPRSVLAALTHTPRVQVTQLVRSLTKMDLVSTTMGVDGESRRGLAPAAFYNAADVIGLRHPVFGRLILEWLSDERGEDDLRKLEPFLEPGLVNEIDWEVVKSDFPLRLLKPIFSRLTPEKENVAFAADLSTRFLRLQRRELEPGLSAWQWRNIETLLDAMGWLDETLYSQSSVLLHSRGITTYKSTSATQDPDEWRDRYRRAVEDFERGVELANKDDTGGEEDPVNVITSLGLLFIGWARKEREHGFEDFSKEISAKAETTLRKVLGERDDNPFAAYGLARFLIDQCRDQPDALSSIEYGKKLAEAIDLLQQEPEAYFLDDWDEIRQQAFVLLDGGRADAVINDLKQEGDELGYALSALQVLEGDIPLDAKQESEGSIQDALKILEEGGGRCTRQSVFADYLRYALFSSLPERLDDPAFPERLARIERLVGTLYLRRPILLYDYAMLCYQQRNFDEGLKAYRELRKGLKFFEVPRERTVLLMEMQTPKSPLLVQIRIVETEPRGIGWAVVETPEKIPGRVRFSVRSFRGRHKPTSTGAITTVHLRLDAAGLFAEPPRD